MLSQNPFTHVVSVFQSIFHCSWVCKMNFLLFTGPKKLHLSHVLVYQGNLKNTKYILSFYHLSRLKKTMFSIFEMFITWTFQWKWHFMLKIIIYRISENYMDLSLVSWNVIIFLECKIFKSKYEKYEYKWCK